MGETIEDGTWNAVEEFFGERLLGPDEVLDAALADTRAAGMPEIAVARRTGQAPAPPGPDPGRPHASWRSAPSAATARSGWPARCPRTAG